MRVKLTIALLACLLGTGEDLCAQSLDQEMAGLADRVSKALVAKGFKNVANLDFTDIQGQPTELGRFLSDQLAVEIVSTGGVSMVDRANLKSILAEHKLTEEGLVNPANAKKLGEFAGVDAIMSGNVTAFDDGVVLMVKAISTESASIVAAGRIRFAKTSDIQQLLNRSISPNNTGAAPAAAGGGGISAGYQEATGVATKDVGSLRVVLKSASLVKLGRNYSGQQNGIRVSLELTSRETQRAIVVGMNANQQRGYNRGSCTLGQGLRASLVDSRGAIHSLPNANLSGLSIIGVGCDDMTGYDPSQIASLIEKQDREGSRGQDKGEYTYGSLSTIGPGQSISVTMTFVQDQQGTASGSPPAWFRMDSELAVGVVAGDSKRSFSLHNLAFDRVGLPPGGVQ